MSNQYGLVYANALTENLPGQVNIHPQHYQAQGVEIAANIYTPADYDPKKTYPALTVTHPNGGVKEQVSGLFAQRMAEAGYITIAADAAYQGASGGEPRYTDNPEFRIGDIHAMADQLLGFPGVDPQRLGAVGICGGGGYTIAAASTDHRFQAVATVSMFNSGRVRRNGFADADTAHIAERIEQANNARNMRLRTGHVEYIGQELTERVHFTEAQLEQIPAGLYREGTQYYGDTHYHPNAQNWYTAESLIYLMRFDAEDRASLLTQPLLLIVGGEADTAYMSETVYAKAENAQSKQLLRIPGASHIQTYWVPEYVDQEVDGLQEFFGNNL